MHLPLTALLLRSGVTPVGALTESFRESVELWLWSNGGLERIEPSDAQLVTAARTGELVIALFDRSTDPPAWRSS